MENLTELEVKVLGEIIECEDASIQPQIDDIQSLSSSKARGVLSSLIKKGKISENEGYYNSI